MFEKILVPLDGSPLAARILPLIEPIARKHRAEVRAVRVLDPYEIDDALLQGIDIFGEARDGLEKALAPLERAGIETRLEILESDDTTQRLIDYALEWGASVIALATHGRMGADRWTHGSIAEELARKASCPLLVANPKALRTWREWTRILVPLDGSEFAESAVPFAANLARAFYAGLVIFHARDEAVAPADDKPLLERRRADLVGLDVRTRSDKGSASYAIVAAAKAEQADMIALTTHGRSGIARLVLGSVAEHVIEHAEVPVLVVPNRIAAHGLATTP